VVVTVSVEDVLNDEGVWGVVVVGDEGEEQAPEGG